MKQHRIPVKAEVEPDPIFEFEEGLRIDEHALDQELVRQPDLFYRVAKYLVLVSSRRDAKKQHVAEVEARVDSELRETAGGRQKKEKKPTETEFKNMIRLDPDMLKASGELLSLNRKVGELTALKEALQAKGYALKELVNLYVNNYYHQNSDGTARAALSDRASDNVRNELKNRRAQYGRTSNERSG